MRAQKINSKIINNYGVLENSVNLNLFSEDLYVEADLKVYEDLDKKKVTDMSLFYQKSNL